MRRNISRYRLIALLLALMMVGLMVLYSAGNESPRLVVAQGLRYGVGLGALWLLSRVSPAQLRSVTPLVFAASLLPLVAVFGERESQAVYFLHQQNVSRLDVVNYLSHGVSKTPGAPAVFISSSSTSASM